MWRFLQISKMWHSQNFNDNFSFYWKCNSEKSTKHLIELSFYSNQVSQEERQISLAFSIIAHDQFSLLETLIASLFRPHNSYCIFVDAKATTEFHNMVQQLVDCYKYQYPQVRFQVHFKLNTCRDVLNVLKKICCKTAILNNEKYGIHIKIKLKKIIWNVWTLHRSTKIGRP